YTNLVIGKAIHCEIFAELSVGKIASPKFPLPVAVRVHLIHEDRALLAPVTSQIALPVAVNIQPPNQTSTLNRTLPHRTADDLPSPVDVPWKANVDRQKSGHKSTSS